MELTQAVSQLAAAAEPTRLRLLVALLTGETSVGDLVTVLGQSQPRVSRHLRLLTEAGLVESFREGRSIFYRWSAAGLDAGVARSVAALATSDDPAISRDRERLQKLARQRERDALRRALRAGQGRDLHVPDGDTVLAELLSATLASGLPPEAILNVGCGSGELLRLLAAPDRFVVGTEPATHRRQLARARLRQAGAPRWSIRDAGPGLLPFAAGAFDLVILQDVLAPARPDDLQAILAEASRVLRPAGHLLVLDRILPTDGELAARLATLGFAVIRRQWLPGRAPDRALFLAGRPEPTPARTGTHD